jgi:hypothetical protein
MKKFFLFLFISTVSLSLNAQKLTFGLNFYTANPQGDYNFLYSGSNVSSPPGVGLGAGRFVFEAGDRECRGAWLCDIWLFLLGFGGFWFSWGRFCRARLFGFRLSRALFFRFWVSRVGGHGNAGDRGRKAQATNQAACDVKTERSFAGHNVGHSFISPVRPGHWTLG